MELRQVKYFVKVAQTGSFSRAAAQLFITQSTLSQQIRQLESALGVELLQRSTRKVALTDYGAAFLPRARQLLADEKACRQQIEDVGELRTGDLSIGSTYTFCPILLETMHIFMRQHPGINLKVRMGTVEELMLMLEREEIEFALSFRPDRVYPNISSEILFSTHLAVAVGEFHALAHEPKINLAQLSHLELALPVRGMQARDKFERLIAAENIPLHVRAEANDMPFLLNLVRHSELATVVSKKTISSGTGLKLIDIDAPNTEMTGCCHHLREAYLSAAARKFIETLS